MTRQGDIEQGGDGFGSGEVEWMIDAVRYVYVEIWIRHGQRDDNGDYKWGEI